MSVTVLEMGELRYVVGKAIQREANLGQGSKYVVL